MQIKKVSGNIREVVISEALDFKRGFELLRVTGKQKTTFWWYKSKRSIMAGKDQEPHLKTGSPLGENRKKQGCMDDNMNSIQIQIQFF